MRLLVRHGINGKEELAIQVAGNAPVGWDIMKQLAWRLDLESPFQVILYLNSTAAILSPVRAISSHMTSTDLEICYLVQNLQVPTAEHYQSLVTALYEKDVVELQGRPQLRLQKSYQFQVQKTNPKTSLLYLLVLIMTIFPFLLCWCKPAIEALRGSPRPGRSQARPGEAWARPRHGRKRIGTRTKRGSWGLETI